MHQQQPRYKFLFALVQNSLAEIRLLGKLVLPTFFRLKKLPQVEFYYVNVSTIDQLKHLSDLLAVTMVDINVRELSKDVEAEFHRGLNFFILQKLFKPHNALDKPFLIFDGFIIQRKRKFL